MWLVRSAKPAPKCPGQHRLARLRSSPASHRQRGTMPWPRLCRRPLGSVVEYSDTIEPPSLDVCVLRGDCR